MYEKDVPSGNMPDDFDRMIGVLDGLPDVIRTAASTLLVTPTLGVGGVRTYIVHTVRQRDVTVKDGKELARGRDTIFLQVVGPQGTVRLAIPAPVADAIARQRDALTGKTRTKIGRERAAADKAAGKVPGFLRGKKGGKK